jgi:hypothetical protein
MSRIIKIFSVSFAMIALTITTANAHLGLGSLKRDLDSRFNEVKSSKDLHPSEKARALSELRILESRYSTALSHSYIPSQKNTAESELRRLTRELQSFDRKLSKSKMESAKLKPKDEEGTESQPETQE